jgi:hypothetical protein
MSIYERGEYVKAEFPYETTGIAERMWIRVEACDDKEEKCSSEGSTTNP